MKGQNKHFSELKLKEIVFISKNIALRCDNNYIISNLYVTIE